MVAHGRRSAAEDSRATLIRGDLRCSVGGCGRVVRLSSAAQGQASATVRSEPRIPELVQPPRRSILGA